MPAPICVHPCGVEAASVSIAKCNQCGYRLPGDLEHKQLAVRPWKPHNRSHEFNAALVAEHVYTPTCRLIRFFSIYAFDIFRRGFRFPELSPLISEPPQCAAAARVFGCKGLWRDHLSCDKRRHGPWLRTERRPAPGTLSAANPLTVKRKLQRSELLQRCSES